MYSRRRLWVGDDQADVGGWVDGWTDGKRRGGQKLESPFLSVTKMLTPSATFVKG